MRALLVLLTACDAARPAPPAPPPPVPPPPVIAHADPSPLPVDPWAAPIPAPEPAAKTPEGNAAWKRDIIALASTTGRYVAGWGTIALDAKRPIRFATLAPSENVNGRGAYVLELAPHHIVELTFYVDGRTSMFAAGDGTMISPASLPWLESDAHELHHDTGHHHGGETLSLGVRDGEIVVLAYTYTNDVTDESEHPIAKTYPSDFACRPRCPLAATYHSYWGSELAVSQPACSAGELVEPTAPTLPETFP
jgi:hypothetical protein